MHPCCVLCRVPSGVSDNGAWLQLPGPKSNAKFLLCSLLMAARNGSLLVGMSSRAPRLPRTRCGLMKALIHNMAMRAGSPGVRARAAATGHVRWGAPRLIRVLGVAMIMIVQPLAEHQWLRILPVARGALRPFRVNVLATVEVQQLHIPGLLRVAFGPGQNVFRQLSHQYRGLRYSAWIAVMSPT